MSKRFTEAEIAEVSSCTADPEEVEARLRNLSHGSNSK